MLSRIPFPLLPAPPSWYPGHMSRFERILPEMLTRTDVVLELRDSRLPLTSINKKLEGALQKWRMERGRGPSTPTSRSYRPSQLQSPPEGGKICEHIVVLNKRDLVPEWGLEPFKKAMENKFPDQTTFFASWNQARDIKALSELLVKIAKTNPAAMEMNVLVVGMPNVGKSTLLNALRNVGIPGPTPKALRTSAQPGHTRSISTRLKLSQDPLVYSYDSPGVMWPFLGRGLKGAERGVKLALIAGIREGLYDMEALAAYLLYRLNVLNPVCPAYLRLLPPAAPVTLDIHDFLDRLATRLGMLKRGGARDMSRAATWFVRWWREEGGLLTAPEPNATSQPRAGWGFDFEWESDAGEGLMIQRRMEECIDVYLKKTEEEEREGGIVSATQQKKEGWKEKLARRAQRAKARRGGRAR